jgi:hypothetical protein
MRKRPVLYIIGAAALMLVLAGCTITPLVSNFRFTSSWSVNGQPVACENRDTFIGYSFNVYNVGQVDSFTETYIGAESGVVEGPFTHFVGEPGVIVSGNNISVENRFVANGQFLPLNTESSYEPNAIIVVPIRPDPSSQVGTTRLVVSVALKNGVTFSSAQNIPIFGNCPAN